MTDPFIYQYLAGGLVFGVGILYAIRQGYISLSKEGLRNLAICLGGLFFFMGIQGYLQYGDMAERPALHIDAPNTAESYPHPDIRANKTEAEILHIQETAKQILSSTNKTAEATTPKTTNRTIGSTLDYGIMVGYFVLMILIGLWFGKGQTTTKDFFFGGQRFSWWLISFSLVATTIGSASFVKYSEIAYGYGIASTQSYMNDWFWVPLLIFGWLPILYFSRIVSIPEYFQRRFGKSTRQMATWLLLAYLIGYVGINLLSMGQALHILVGWPIFISALVVAIISTTYVAFGGQTSVIMTDLFQGLMLFATGLLLLFFGANYLGGWDIFWEYLPRGHRTAFSDFNGSKSFPAVGIFWQDGMANSAMFYFLNQGMVMRLVAARSVDDSRKSLMVMLLVLMPLASIVVASGGWVGKSLVTAGILPEMAPKEAFFITSNFLATPGVFGLVMAALTAALMSTIDTVITAIAAIVVNDIYTPLYPNANDSQMLRIARISSISIAIIGVLLVPIFQGFGSILEAHGAFTAAITPPLVITLLLGIFWRRYSSKAAILTMTLGLGIIILSTIFPDMITPFAHGVPMGDAKEGLFGGANQHNFMRAFFGLLSCMGIGLVAGYIFPNPHPENHKGLVWGTVLDAIRNYKGKEGSEKMSDWKQVHIIAITQEEDHDHPIVHISPDIATTLQATSGDLLYITDPRDWLGGLHSTHSTIGTVDANLPQNTIQISQDLMNNIFGDIQTVTIRRMY